MKDANALRGRSCNLEFSYPINNIVMLMLASFYDKMQ